MKISSIVFAILALVLMPIVAVGVLPGNATTKDGNAKSYWLDPNDATAAKSCVQNGGTVSARDGQKVCAMQPPEVLVSFKIKKNPPYTAKACSDRRGAISINKNRQKVCTLTSGPSSLSVWGSCEECNQLCTGPCFMGGGMNCVCYPAAY